MLTIRIFKSKVGIDQEYASTLRNTNKSLKKVWHRGKLQELHALLVHLPSSRGFRISTYQKHHHRPTHSHRWIIIHYIMISNLCDTNYEPYSDLLHNWSRGVQMTPNGYSSWRRGNLFNAHCNRTFFSCIPSAQSVLWKTTMPAPPLQEKTTVVLKPSLLRIEDKNYIVHNMNTLYFLHI